MRSRGPVCVEPSVEVAELYFVDIGCMRYQMEVLRVVLCQVEEIEARR